MIDTILIAASVVTSLTVIFGFLYKTYNFFRQLEKKYDEMNELLKSNTIHLLKLAVLNERLPMVDRLKAGEQYLDLGGNGMIRKVYLHLLDEYEKEFEEGEKYER